MCLLSAKSYQISPGAPNQSCNGTGLTPETAGKHCSWEAEGNMLQPTSVAPAMLSGTFQHMLLRDTLRFGGPYSVLALPCLPPTSLFHCEGRANLEQQGKVSPCLAAWCVNGSTGAVAMASVQTPTSQQQGPSGSATPPETRLRSTALLQPQDACSSLGLVQARWEESWAEQ